MTTSLRLFLVGGLALLAIGLLGYSGVSWRERVTQLEFQVASLTTQLADANRPDLSFYYALMHQDVEQHLATLVASEDEAARLRSADQIYRLIEGLPAVFPDGLLVHQALFGAAAADKISVRASYRDGISDIVDRRIDAVELPEEGIIDVDANLVGALSGFVAAIGGLGSGLGALSLFLMGGNRRDIEQEMLSLDLELKRIDLAKARYSARDALQGEGA